MKLEIKPSSIHGQGVFSIQPIARGTVIHKIDDSRVVDDKHPLRPDLGENPDHQDWLPDGTTVLMKKPAGFFNHSCVPNIFIYSINRERFILTMCDIQPDEELLFDYSINAVNGDLWECRCGAPNCRGRHKCDFFALPEPQQLEYLPFLDPWFAEIHRDRIGILLKRNAG